MLDLRLHKRKIVTLLVVATMVAPVAVFGINRIMSADVTKALTFAIPEGYETFKDATLYDCVARAYAEETGNSVPSTGLTDAQLAEVTKVVCSGKDISEDEWVSDATGIEKMINLDYLDLDYNRLTSIDLTNNAKLTYVDIGGAKINELDVSNNTMLQYLKVDNSLLTELDVSKNTNLGYLNVSFSQLIQLDVTKNDNLRELHVAHNQLTELDVTKNIHLVELSVENGYVFAFKNQLTKLDVSKNTELTKLDARYNQLTELDVTNNTKLEELDVGGNQLTELDVTKNTELDYLVVSINQLTELDVSKNIKLKTLYVNENNLSEFDVTKNIELITLVVAENNLSELDVTKNTKLDFLQVDNNNLSELDVTNIIDMKHLIASKNFLTELDVSKNTKLSGLYVSDNQISELDVTKNTELIFLEVENNQLTGLDVTKNSKLLRLNVDCNKIVGLDLTQNIELNTLLVARNQLNELDVSQNTKLVELRADQNQLNELDVRNNNNLQKLSGDLDLPIRANINYAYIDGELVFDLSNLKFIDSAIDKDGYSYDETNKTLLVSELNATDGYAKINAFLPRTSTGLIVMNKLILSDYVLTLDDNDGSDNTSSLVCLPESESGDSCVVVLPGMDSAAVVEDGATREFLGWADTADATEPQYMANEEMALTGRKTVYAIWQDVHTYTLNYDLNLEDASASGIESVSCVTSGESCNVNITTVVPTRTGYVFLGWADTASANEGNNNYAAGANITLTGNKTLYAIWAPTYTLNFEVGESETLVESVICYPTATDGACEVTIPKTRPTLEGYEFFGWTKTEGDTMADYLPNEKYNFTKGNYSETLYAIWADGKVTWVQGQDMVETDDLNAILVIDYPSRSFVKLFIDGKEVNEKYYKIETEKTKITIDNEYLKELGPGTYTLEVAYEDDITVKTLFNIEEKEPEIKVPDTGNETHDDNNGAGVIMIAILPALGVAMITVMVWMVLRKYHTMRKW